MRNLCPLSSYSIGRVSKSVGLPGSSTTMSAMESSVCPSTGGRTCVDRRQRQWLGWAQMSVVGVARLFKQS